MILEVHYFLWFGALTPIYGYMSVYARHYANVSPRAFGILSMILPFVSLLAKPVFCSLADRYRAHRTCFLLFLIFALIGYGSFGILPFFVSPPSKELGLRAETWSIICLMVMMAEFSMSIMTCLSDSFAMDQAEKNGQTYGSIRVWGTLGWGMGALLLAFANEFKNLPLLVPGLIMTIVFLSTDIIIMTLWRDRSVFDLSKCDNPEREEDKLNEVEIVNTIMPVSPIIPSCLEDPSDQSRKYISENMIVATECTKAKQIVDGPPEDVKVRPKTISLGLQLSILALVMRRRKSLLRYMIIFVVAGALTSIQWAYLFLYLENIYSSQFTYISGLCMVGQSILGELPFFILSHRLIKFLGRSSALSLSIASIGVRYLLYALLLPNVSLYFILPIEILQGPSFGLFYVVMTEVGMDYSNCDDIVSTLVDRHYISKNTDEIQATRKVLAATMQGLVSACYEGLGVGLGYLIGGTVIYSYDFDHLWIGAALIALSVSVVNVLIDGIIYHWNRKTETKPDLVA